MIAPVARERIDKKQKVRPNHCIPIRHGKLGVVVKDVSYRKAVGMKSQDGLLTWPSDGCAKICFIGEGEGQRRETGNKRWKKQNCECSFQDTLSLKASADFANEFLHR